MQEVEAKAVLKDAVSVLKKLTELGCEFGEAVTQDDTIYVAKTGSIETFLSNALFLRLRVLGNGKVIYTAKYHENRSAASDTYATEHESEVGSREEMEAILKLQGYSEAVRVLKVRRTTHYKGMELCLDEVEGLGSFIEAERLVSANDDVEKVYEELRAFLLTLGIDASDVTTMRYDMMLLTKQA